MRLSAKAPIVIRGEEITHLDADGYKHLPRATSLPDGKVLATSGGKWAPSDLSGISVSSVFGRTGAVAAQTGDYTAEQVGAEPYAGAPAATSFWRSTAAGVRAWVQLVAADITDLATTLAAYLTKANPAFTGRLTGPSAALSGALTANGAVSQAWGAGYKPVAFGLGASIAVKNWPDGDTLYLLNNVYRASGDVSKAISGTGNCSIALIGADGGFAYQTAGNPGAGESVNLVEKFSVDAAGALWLNGTPRVTAGGDGRFVGLRASEIAGTGIRPLVALSDGTIDDQAAPTFLGTIGAAAAVHDHASITGSAAKLTTPRSIGMAGDGTWSVSFDGSANASGAMTLTSIITAGGPVGSATKAPQFTWDSKGRLTAVDEVTITPAWSSITSKPTTFSGLGVTMLASDIPNHASRHHWNGADPISGQSISGLRTTSSPTFYGIIIGDGGIDLGNLVGIGRNGSGGIYMRPSAGVVRLTVEDTNVYCSTAFSANSGQFTNLSTGFVRSSSVGQLSSSSLLASELPNHASRHEYGGADSLAGQSIAGLRKVDSPSFLNLSLDGALQFSGYNITSYDGDAFYVETSGGWQLIKSTLAEGTIIATGLFPTGNGIACGKDSYRWNFRSNDLNHECETVTATNTTPGSSIQTIPSTGNYFKLTNGSGGATRNYRIPNAPGSGIGKRLALFSGSSDPDGFTRIYPPSSGQLWNGGAQVTTYVEFNSSAGALKIVMDSDGSNWYI